MSDWTHWDEQPETRRFMHLRAESDEQLQSGLILLAGGGLEGVERLSFPAGSVHDKWSMVEEWEDGCMLRFRSRLSPRALATSCGDALGHMSAWAIHDGKRDVQQSGSPVFSRFLETPRAALSRMVAVVGREDSSAEGPRARILSTLKCVEAFTYGDGAVFLVHEGGEKLASATARLRNFVLHLAGTEDGGSWFYDDANAPPHLWEEVDLAGLAFDSD